MWRTRLHISMKISKNYPPLASLRIPPPPPHAFPLFKQSLSGLFARCYHRDQVEIESFLNLLIASEGSTAAVTELVRYIFYQLHVTLFTE